MINYELKITIAALFTMTVIGIMLNVIGYIIA